VGKISRQNVADRDPTDLTAVENHRDLVVGAVTLNLAKGR
jgi:hypothetical protein